MNGQADKRFDAAARLHRAALSAHGPVAAAITHVRRATATAERRLAWSISSDRRSAGRWASDARSARSYPTARGPIGAAVAPFLIAITPSSSRERPFSPPSAPRRPAQLEQRGDVAALVVRRYHARLNTSIGRLVEDHVDFARRRACIAVARRRVGRTKPGAYAKAVARRGRCRC